MCHYIEDEVSAKYDITHGLGLLNEMAKIASRDEVLHGFVDLNQQDIVNILKMCL